jgi:hypothetical protein
VVAGDAEGEGAVASGEVGRTGYCSQCHGPDARGLPCPHLVAFVTQQMQPPATGLEDALTALFHRSYRVNAIKEALDVIPELVVPTVDELQDLGHDIAPLVGRAPRGRPKVHKPAGRKPKEALIAKGADTDSTPKGRKPNDPALKRIKSAGEQNRIEARNE